MVLAFTVGNLISPIISLLPLSQIAAQDELLASSFYWGFMFLNFFILLFSLLLFDRVADILTNSAFPQLPKYILAIFLVSNIVIRTSFWSAHQQMLTFFSPLLCIYLTLNIVLADQLNPKKIYLIALLGGFLLLTYGNFLLLFPCILLAMTIQLFRSNKFWQLQMLKLFVPFILLFIFPIVMWFSILLMVNGSIYTHEVSAYRQFVWIFDKLSISFKDFYEQLISFTALYWVSIYRTVLIFLVGLFLLKIFNSLSQLKNKDKDYPTNYLLTRNWIAVVFTLYLFFFWLMGYYSERLTYTLVPIVLCLIVLELNMIISRGRALTVKLVYVLLLFLALGWVYRGVTFYEPYKELSETKKIEFLQTYI